MAISVTQTRYADLDDMRRFYQGLCGRLSFSATCETQGDSPSKVAVIPGFRLANGVRVAINFKYRNVASGPTLQIFDTDDSQTRISLATAMAIKDSDGADLTGEEVKSLDGYCELIYDRSLGGWVLLANRQKNVFIYGTDRPTNALTGMVWLKPKT